MSSASVSIELGPWPKPLTPEQEQLLTKVEREARAHGYVLTRRETEHNVYFRAATGERARTPEVLT